MKFEIFAEVTIRDDKGNIQYIYPKVKLNSYVQAMINLLRANMNASNDSVLAIDGYNRQTAFSTAYGFSVVATAGDAAWGVVVGTGTTATAISDSKLETQIANGNGAGQLNYGAVSVGQPVTVGSTRQFTVARTFTNNSGADINVKEVGLYSKFSVSGYTACIERSLLDFVVGNGQSGTVTYTISASV